MIRGVGTTARARLAAALLATTVAGGGALAGEAGRHVGDPWSYLVAHHAHQPTVTPALARPARPVGDMNAPAPEAEMSSDVKQSVGCVVTGTTATALALAAGAENLVNVVSGGLVTSANPVVLYMGVVGVVFASFCSIGQALTPLYVYLTEPAASPAIPSGATHDVCASCRPAHGGGPIRHASGPLSRELPRVAAAEAERVRTTAASAPAAPNLRNALAELSGRRTRQH